MGEASAAAGGQGAGAREFYELRAYDFASAVQQTRFDGYLEKALVPALNRAGVKPVGVFHLEGQPDSFKTYVLLPFRSAEEAARLADRLAGDPGLQTAGADVIALHAADPPYRRMESSLMLAFSGAPKLHVPAETAAGRGMVFELRTYESHNERAAKKKIEMFNAGEIGIFERAGFQPVFFGETLLGPEMPNLTYMVTYAAGTDRGAYWNKFMADPEKARLFAIPEYQDKEIVSKIVSRMLKPTSASQI